MRRPILTANWKMNKTAAEACAFARDFLDLLAAEPRAAERSDIVLAPSATALAPLAKALEGGPVELGAQNVSAEASGAFTGEISVGMLAEAGCRYGIVGHSERRALYGEKDDGISQKARALLAGGLRPIVCVGESLEEREAEQTFEVVGRQLAGSLDGISPDQAGELVVAYEPVWAIGTGQNATPAQAQEVHAFIRAQLNERMGEASQHVRIQYGGSVKPENAAALMAEQDIDGALVGGAALEAASFAKIVCFDLRNQDQEN